MIYRNIRHATNVSSNVVHRRVGELIKRLVATIVKEADLRELVETLGEVGRRIQGDISPYYYLYDFCGDLLSAI